MDRTQSQISHGEIAIEELTRLNCGGVRLHTVRYDSKHRL